MRRSVFVVSSVALLALGACRLFVDLDGLGDGDGVKPGGDAGPDTSSTIDGGDVVDTGAGDVAVDVVQTDAGTDADVDAGPPCPGTGGPTAVRVPLPDGGSFCIDSTEVTNAQYQAFLAANVSTSNQGAFCGWNTTYVPSSDWPPAVGSDNKPVGWVDWCDARAFCAWSGKRLCGATGGGGNLTLATIENPLLNEWTYACSKAGERVYPYGSIFDATKCNAGATADPDVIENVKSRPGCEGGYAGIYDLGGNVHEWIDGCIIGGDPATDFCGFSLQSYSHDQPDMACTQFDGRARNDPLDEIGIRCCSN